MGVRILYDTGSQTGCMFDSVTGQAFGPVFESWNARQEIEDFLDWLRENPPVWSVAVADERRDERDARNFSPDELVRLVDHWRTIQEYIGEGISNA